MQLKYSARENMSSMASETGVQGGRPASAERHEAASRPVDLVHLSRYTLGERALEREVLALFCTQSSVYIERLGKAGSLKEWREAAHSLKGSAAAIGAWRAAAIAERAEALSGEALAQDRAACLREIELLVREATAYIGALLESR
jgi:HPt (histidine-containing phosphotransfer) domain-containing protein